MIQYYSDYKNWEDFNNGMFEIPKKKEENLCVEKAISLLSNCNLFFEICEQILINWPISTKVNLTNVGCNRKAWLGQSACNFKYKVPEICTRIAWSKLSIEQQNKANEVADKIIKKFELSYER